MSLFAGLAAALPHAQATISIERLQVDGGQNVLVIRGQFEFNDRPEALAAAVAESGARIVTFHSNGGNVHAAMAFGRAIRALGLETIQLRAAECASACALAFIGGVRRTAEPGSRGPSILILGRHSNRRSEHGLRRQCGVLRQNGIARRRPQGKGEVCGSVAETGLQCKAWFGVRCLCLDVCRQWYRRVVRAQSQAREIIFGNRGFLLDLEPLDKQDRIRNGKGPGNGQEGARTGQDNFSVAGAEWRLSGRLRRLRRHVESLRPSRFHWSEARGSRLVLRARRGIWLQNGVACLRKVRPRVSARRGVECLR